MEIFDKKEPEAMSIDQEQPTAAHPPAARHREPVPRFVLVLGGARSGKSTFAERLATTSGRSVAFIATATASDDEMRQRIAQHQASRPVAWQTIEEPLDLALAVRRAGTLADVLLLDCITIWLSNWMAPEAHIQHHALLPAGKLQDNDALSAVDALLDAVASLPTNKTLIAVTNEVGLGVVPMHPLGRAYRDTLGYVNQRLAHAADRVYLMVAGMAVDIKRLHEEAAI
jgi:adenosylcobinamide kinase / adenosylcobinamide-phosphate guanylyltransferase